MSLTPGDAGEVLKARGMRSTPQRRAIVSVFDGGRNEHLSADEVYAQASAGVMPPVGIWRTQARASAATFPESCRARSAVSTGNSWHRQHWR